MSFALVRLSGQRHTLEHMFDPSSDSPPTGDAGAAPVPHGNAPTKGIESSGAAALSGAGAADGVGAPGKAVATASVAAASGTISNSSTDVTADATSSAHVDATSSAHIDATSSAHVDATSSAHIETSSAGGFASAGLAGFGGVQLGELSSDQEVARVAGFAEAAKRIKQLRARVSSGPGEGQRAKGRRAQRVTKPRRQAKATLKTQTPPAVAAPPTILSLEMTGSDDVSGLNGRTGLDCRTDSSIPAAPQRSAGKLAPDTRVGRSVGLGFDESSACERDLAERLHGVWLSVRPAWVDPDWYAMPLSAQARQLMTLPAGLELLTALHALPTGRCPVDHSGDVASGGPVRGTQPGLLCECQLVAVGAWEAVSNWQQATAARFLVDSMGHQPLTAPPGVDEHTRRHWVIDPVREEAAIVCRTSPDSIHNRLHTNRAMLDHPELFHLAERGGCAFWAAKFITQSLSDYPPTDARAVTCEVARRVNARLQTNASPWTNAQIRALAKRLAAKLDKKAQANARAEAHAARGVWVQDEDHGMSTLRALIPQVEAERIIRTLTHNAKALDDPHRTMDQKRADLLTDLLLLPYLTTNTALATSGSNCHGYPCPHGCLDHGRKSHHDPNNSSSAPDPTGSPDHNNCHGCPDSGPNGNDSHHHCGCAGCSGPSASTNSSILPTNTGAGTGTGSGVEIQVVVKLDTLLGLNTDPAHLIGSGDIPADTARALAADHKWRAWVTNTNGTVVATSPNTYTPSQALARLIRAREPYCRMPGCRRTATNSDLDHTIPWPRGKTTPTNLGPICRRHHNLKTHQGWKLTNHLYPPDQSSESSTSRSKPPGYRDPTHNPFTEEPPAPTQWDNSAHNRSSAAASGTGHRSPDRTPPATITRWPWTTPTGNPHPTQPRKPLPEQDCPF